MIDLLLFCLLVVTIVGAVFLFDRAHVLTTTQRARVIITALACVLWRMAIYIGTGDGNQPEAALYTGCLALLATICATFRTRDWELVTHEVHRY